MLMKNNKNIFLYLIIIIFSLTQSLTADEFDITASNIKLFQDNQKILADGNVVIVGEDGITIVAESGIKSRDEILKYNDSGVFNFLIGESILKSNNIANKIHEFLN